MFEVCDAPFVNSETCNVVLFEITVKLHTLLNWVQTESVPGLADLDQPGQGSLHPRRSSVIAYAKI